MKKELLEKGFDAAFAAYCDHTVLRAYTKSEAVKEFCEEAKKYKPASKEEADLVLAALKTGAYTVSKVKNSVTKSHAPAP
ncbi:MAG: hypothetical protein J6R89_00705, partial [Clostridia bacterium]|nr:hypothetical protein [Clostridia bacterium]